ncbi:MAG: hypothetical protein ACJAZ9_000167 [Neolewinella sp.]|jgi:hypothetical protein
MKIFTLTTFLLLSASMLFTSCGTEATVEEEPVVIADPTAGLPDDLVATLNAHGGLDKWQEFRQLGYAMLKGGDKEIQLVDLYDRREYIKQPAAEGEDPVEMGFDGENVWVTADTSYQGNPVFYKNLMFYFYAMPWVLADEGIVYTQAEPITFDGVTYPGIMVSYDDGIGFSPKDNYRLHYDPTSKKMRWLGYTVTGGTGKTSEKFSWIEYPTWSDHGGVQLADSLVWYTTENNLPIAPRNARVFTEVALDKVAADDKRFARPDGARIVE